MGEVPTGVARPNSHNSIEQFTDGYGEGEVGTKGTFGGDFFSGLGQQRKKKEPPPSNRSKGNADMPKMSDREINTGIYDAEGVRLPSSVEAMSRTPHSDTNMVDGIRPPLPGSSGSNWRMMKLKRTYEAAEDEGRSTEELGLERFGTAEAWEAVKEERRILDERAMANARGQGRSREQQERRNFDGARSNANAPDTSMDDGLDEFGRERRRDDAPSGAPSSATTAVGRYIFTDPSKAADPSSRPPSRGGSFRRPGGVDEESGDRAEFLSRPQTPTLHHQRERNGTKPSTPIPSVFTPLLLTGGPGGAMRKPSQLSASTNAEQAAKKAIVDSQANDDLLSQPIMSPTALNKLQAKILRARLMASGSEELKNMEEQYEREMQRSRQGDAGQGYFDTANLGGAAKGEAQIAVLPTLDGRGRLYDVGKGTEKDEEDQAAGTGNKRKRMEKVTSCPHACRPWLLKGFPKTVF